jgi:hypothetical protein
MARVSVQSLLVCFKSQTGQTRKRKMVLKEKKKEKKEKSFQVRHWLQNDLFVIIIIDTPLSTLDDETGQLDLIEAHNDIGSKLKEVVLFSTLVSCESGHWHTFLLNISLLYSYSMILPMKLINGPQNLSKTKYFQRTLIFMLPITI